MVGTTLTAGFWGAVEDCLIEFHHIPRNDAAQKVTDLWRRLANITSTKSSSSECQPAFDDMIYHEEPWYLACNLANEEIPLEPYREAYEQILKQNHLA